MKPMRTFLLLTAGVFVAAALGQGTRKAAAASASETQQLQQSQPPPTIGSAVDREISNIEKLIVEAAEAMPEDKFNFSPESLNIPGSDYKGVRTFALQVRHVAASNYAIWSPITGDKFPQDFIGHFDSREYVAEPRQQQIESPATGHIWRGPRIRSLWADGGVFADEWHCAAG